MKESIRIRSITYFFRNRKSGYSMHRVFMPIVSALQDYCKNDEIHHIDALCHRADPISVFRNILYAFRHRNTRGINHVTGDCHYLILGLVGCKKVLTIHDLVTLQLSGNKFKRWFLRKMWFELPLKKADIITCISEKTRQEVLREFDVNPEKVLVVHNAVDSAYRYAPRSFNETCPRILHIGTGWNKNLEGVILALRGIRCVLVIVGCLTDGQRELLCEGGIKYENRVGISDEQMLQEYIDCDIVSFPSLFEGFGMPIIEGQAIGRPVITSDLEPMTEVAGDGAVFVNPRDVASIRRGVLKVISDESVRDDVVLRGLQNAKRYDVDVITRRYGEVYDRLEMGYANVI